ncbi:uncharacterized protein TRIADDRAFT_61362 [Trichoplax adhaerens]|uniref:Uncharacterized protein n=1 Tax=Trichoplax adhaerens TaxID=10228 RepID=B3SAS4_TRIAD|nr:hypothetical protein TRIADDRAFT_61362 [Trichoplax adhaerens]EDV20154.1 hypothetical protein TRIADDRAFT_61362 [Trichoplax adhaerens]|eukprot:XP_002117315.1 hypothetical protein TRIADDRAFT_61362 [Trichoplax adhaerens]
MSVLDTLSNECINLYYLRFLQDVNAKSQFSATFNIEAIQQKKAIDEDNQASNDSDDEYEHVPFENNRKERLKYAFTKIWPVVCAQFLCFSVTYSIFPGITCRVISVHKRNNSMLTGVLFVPVACFLLFAISNFVGRFISKLIQLEISRSSKLIHDMPDY